VTACDCDCNTRALHKDNELQPAKMFNDLTTSLTTKLAMRKMGISKDTFNFTSAPAAKPSSANEFEDEGDPNSNWPKWMSVRKLPLTAQAWLAPPPPSVAVATECPRIGGPAPLDRDRQLDLTMSTGRRQQVLVVFLRCAGCACTSTSPFPLMRLPKLIKRVDSCTKDLPRSPRPLDPL
jgi:hypothetical protein